MKVIVCLDERLGMMFNNRRQSRDSVLISDVVADLDGEKLYISPYSEKLFDGMDVKLKIKDEPLRAAKRDSVCFIENCSLAEYKKEIDKVVIYRWNRHDPCDFYFDLNMEGYTLVATTEFAGSSHEKITKEVYIK